MANVIKYYLSYDGNPIGLFNTLDDAEYQAAMDSGWTEQEYKENFNLLNRNVINMVAMRLAKMDLVVYIFLIKWNWMNKVILLL